jgi:2-oxo-4-hydroxy-4-carboxy--5-ureidoimidazoline (OHCU) decarboxylase
VSSSAIFKSSTVPRTILSMLDTGQKSQSLALVEAHAEMLEHVQPSKQMKADSEMVGKAHSGLDAIWPNLQRNTV